MKQRKTVGLARLVARVGTSVRRMTVITLIAGAVLATAGLTGAVALAEAPKDTMQVVTIELKKGRVFSPEGCNCRVTSSVIPKDGSRVDKSKEMQLKPGEEVDYQEVFEGISAPFTWVLTISEAATELLSLSADVDGTGEPRPYKGVNFPSKANVRLQGMEPPVGDFIPVTHPGGALGVALVATLKQDVGAVLLSITKPGEEPEVIPLLWGKGDRRVELKPLVTLLQKEARSFEVRDAKTKDTLAKADAVFDFVAGTGSLQPTILPESPIAKLRVLHSRVIRQITVTYPDPRLANPKIADVKKEDKIFYMEAGYGAVGTAPIGGEVGSMVVKVTGDGGRPVKGAMVRIILQAPKGADLGKQANPEGVKALPTGEDGTLVVPEVPVGEYVVDVNAKGFKQESRKVVVLSGEPTQVVVAMHPTLVARIMPWLLGVVVTLAVTGLLLLVIRSLLTSHGLRRRYV